MMGGCHRTEWGGCDIRHTSRLWFGRAQQFIQRRLRVSDDQPFLFRSPLTFGGFSRLWFVGHTVLSQWFPLTGLVPPPGIGPGMTNRPRECKSRLSAISSTGGIVEGVEGFGPSACRLVIGCSIRLSYTPSTLQHE